MVFSFFSRGYPSRFPALYSDAWYNSYYPHCSCSPDGRRKCKIKSGVFVIPVKLSLVSRMMLNLATENHVVDFFRKRKQRWFRHFSLLLVWTHWPKHYLVVDCRLWLEGLIHLLPLQFRLFWLVVSVMIRILPYRYF